jgi:hypothetical protein
LKIGTLLIILAFSSLAIAGSNSNDGDFSTSIVGIWSAEYKGDNFSVYGESSYRKDGTKSDRGKICKNGDCFILELEGTYVVKDGFLIATVTSSNSPDHEPGKVFKDKIKSVTHNTLILINNKGTEQIRKKVEVPRYVSK